MKHGLLITMLEPNTYKLEIYIKKSSNWHSVYSDTLNWLFLLEIEIADYNKDEYSDLRIKTASSRPLDFIYFSCYYTKI